jgi:tetratricopeptide (TPR) repeat protein
MRKISLLFFAAVFILGGCAKTSYIEKPSPLPAEKFFKTKKYEEALKVTLGNKKGFSNPAVQKLLQNINDQLITVQLYLQKSIIAMMEGDLQQAQYHVKQALKLYPNHRLSQLIHQALMELPPKVISQKEKEPNKKEHQNTEQYQNKAKAFKKKEPIKPIQLVCEDKKGADMYLNLGQKNFEAGNLELAKICWRQALFLAPSHEKARNRLIQLLTKEGLKLFGQGKIEESIQQWEMARKLDPENKELKNYLKKAILAHKKIKSIPKVN